MSWIKEAIGDVHQSERNIKRYRSLKKKFEDAKKRLYATQSGSHFALQELAEEKLVKINADIRDKVNSLICGENNQKKALDSPHKVSAVIDDIILSIDGRIEKELIKLKARRPDEL